MSINHQTWSPHDSIQSQSTRHSLHQTPKHQSQTKTSKSSPIPNHPKMSLLHLKLILLVAAGLASASPAQAVPRQDVSSNQPTGTAVGGALDLTYARPTPGPMPFAQVESVEHLTIRITNRQGEAVTTAHYSNAGGPAPVSGNTLPGTIANGATAAFAVPTGVRRNMEGNLKTTRG